MSLVELVHALGIGIDINTNPIEFTYLNQLLKKWTMLQN